MIYVPQNPQLAIKWNVTYIQIHLIPKALLLTTTPVFSKPAWSLRITEALLTKTDSHEPSQT